MSVGYRHGSSAGSLCLDDAPAAPCGRCSNHGRLAGLRRYAQWAATMQDRLFVTVTTAAPMSDAQVETSRAILSKRYGTAVDLAISIDQVIGGFRLRAGMTAIDASLATRIAAARTRSPANCSHTHNFLS